MSGSARTLLEELRPGEAPLWVHPEWAARYDWLVQGTTGAGEGEPFDLGLFGAQPVGEAMARWRKLREEAGIPAALHARQVHAGEVRVPEQLPAEGLLVLDGFDGHATAQRGVLLTVSVADCIPVSVVDPVRRAIALVHAGWRGVAAGIAERAVGVLAGLGSAPGDLVAHAGPAICGRCYEVGPEVHAAIHPDIPPPPAAMPIDLRDAVATRLVSRGLAPESVTVSGHCTRCGPGGFFSHRAGSAARQMGVLGVR